MNNNEQTNGKSNGSENLFKPTLSIYLPVEINRETLNKILELLGLPDAPLPIEQVDQINLQITLTEDKSND